MNPLVNLVGHPYTLIDMGQHMRTTFRSLRSIMLEPLLTDVYGIEKPENDYLVEFSGALQSQQADINIFHINGNEVEQVMAHLSFQNRWDGYNIIYPFWELSRYPIQWAEMLDLFDEIWTGSSFIQNSIQSVCKKPVIHMPLACEVALRSFLSRRYFGLPEVDYLFLVFLDVRSFVTRKNPYAVIKSFQALLKEKPYARTRLVIKINGAKINSDIVTEIKDMLGAVVDHVSIICNVMTDNEVMNLVRTCDCFISLHRSEGYGLRMAEAMALGKPVIATGYSGNMDFMNESVSFPVSYTLTPVLEGQYPQWSGQVWADPDIEEATRIMLSLVDNPELGRNVGRRARLHMAKNFSYIKTGLRYRQRLEVITALSCYSGSECVNRFETL